MASSLSEDEFQRMQIQLIELRTENYQLEDRNKRHERELTAVRAETQELRKELEKANKVISKSKKAKEVELLVQENEGLQRKLHSQEEDFRLQNGTLMQELGRLVSENESLEKQVKEQPECVSSSNQPSEAPSEQSDELRRLQAQNSALQKSLNSCEKEHQVELNTLQKAISELQQKCGRLGEMHSFSDEVDRCPSDADSFEEDITENLVTTTAASTTHRELPHSSVSPAVEVRQAEDTAQQLREVRLNLETEREEKELLRQTLQNVQKSGKEEIHILQEELEKITEKFKKKQESYVHLQEEKELLYLQLSEKIQRLESSKDQEVTHLMTRSSSLQNDLTKCSQTLDEVRSVSGQKIEQLESHVTELQQKLKMLEEQEGKSYQRIRELEELVASLEDEVDEAGLEQSQGLLDQLSLLKRDNANLSRSNLELRKRIEELGCQIKEGEESLQRELEQTRAAQQDRDTQITALQELNKVADKRKVLLDELAIKYQTATDQHRDQIKSAEEAHKAEVDLMSAQIDELQKKLRKLRDIESKLEETKNQMNSLDNTKSWLERTLKDTDEALDRSRQEYEEKLAERELLHQSQLSELTAEHQEGVDSLKNSHQNSLQELESQIEKERESKAELGTEISTLKQEIKDKKDEKKLHEKKGMTVVKDLKKQLQLERKRAEKLQERLQEYLQSDTRSRTSVDELLRCQTEGERYYGDSSSVGSWSTGGLSRDNATPLSPDEESPSSLEQEHTDLLKRITDLQAEKWTLEAKLSHLEESNSSMCEDLLSKTAIIEHYVMASRPGNVSQSSSQDKLTLKHVIDFVKNKGDEDLREMNRKLQNIVEETLTKNMHLEKDLESLSSELVRLSKQAVVPVQSCESQASGEQVQPPTNT